VDRRLSLPGLRSRRGVIAIRSGDGMTTKQPPPTATAGAFPAIPEPARPARASLLLSSSAAPPWFLVACLPLPGPRAGRRDRRQPHARRPADADPQTAGRRPRRGRP